MSFCTKGSHRDPDRCPVHKAGWPERWQGPEISAFCLCCGNVDTNLVSLNWTLVLSSTFLSHISHLQIPPTALCHCSQSHPSPPSNYDACIIARVPTLCFCPPTPTYLHYRREFYSKTKQWCHKRIMVLRGKHTIFGILVRECITRYVPLLALLFLGLILYVML